MVLDTSAFIGGFDPFSIREERVIPPNVEEEVVRSNLMKLRFCTAVESGAIKIIAPEQRHIDEVRSCATSLGDSFFLSEADMQVLALGLQFKTRGYVPLIVTDDYSIQNVATRLGVGHVSVTTSGIKRLLSWVRYCPACHRTYPANFKATECPICGTKLKRKPQRQPTSTNL